MALKQRNLIEYLKQTHKDKFSPALFSTWQNEFRKFSLAEFLVHNRIFPRREMDDILLQLPCDDEAEQKKWAGISHIRMVEEVASGGMGSIYRAFHTHYGQFCAIKVIKNCESLQGEEARRRFFRETRIMQEISHPNIVQCLDSILLPESDMPALCLEWIEGFNLEQFVYQYGIFSERKALRLIQEMAKAMCYYHSMEIVHRDIKPANILLPVNSPAKLADFGLARGSREFSLTQGYLGTVEYSSPEQIKVCPLDIRSDIYSLGLTLYFCLTGRTPFKGESYFQASARIHDNTRIPLISEIKASENTKSILQKMVQLEPGQRHASPQELLQDIQQILQWEFQPTDANQKPISIPEQETRHSIITMKQSKISLQNNQDGLVAMSEAESQLSVNGQDIPSKVWKPIQPGDKVRLGEIEYTLVSGYSKNRVPSQDSFCKAITQAYSPDDWEVTPPQNATPTEISPTKNFQDKAISKDESARKNAGVPTQFALLQNPEQIFHVAISTSDKNTAHRDVQIRPKHDLMAQFKAGDTVQFSITASEKSYIYLFNIGPTGNITLLFPNDYRNDNMVERSKQYLFPNDEDGFEYTFTPPHGTETFKVFAFMEPVPVEQVQKTCGLCIPSEKRDVAIVQKNIKTLAKNIQSLPIPKWAQATCSVVVVLNKA